MCSISPLRSVPPLRGSLALCTWHSCVWRRTESRWEPWCWCFCCRWLWAERLSCCLLHLPPLFSSFYTRALHTAPTLRDRASPSTPILHVHEREYRVPTNPRSMPLRNEMSITRMWQPTSPCGGAFPEFTMSLILPSLHPSFHPKLVFVTDCSFGLSARFLDWKLWMTMNGFSQRMVVKEHEKSCIYIKSRVFDSRWTQGNVHIIFLFFLKRHLCLSRA